MTVSFPYVPIPLKPPAAPSHPAGAAFFHRPVVTVRIVGPGGQQQKLPDTLVDAGSEDCIFPLDLVAALGIPLLPPTPHQLKWRGSSFPLRFAETTLQLMHNADSCWEWRAIIGFCAAPLPYQIFGYLGGLQHFDAKYRGADQILDLAPNASFPGRLRKFP